MLAEHPGKWVRFPPDGSRGISVLSLADHFGATSMLARIKKQSLPASIWPIRVERPRLFVCSLVLLGVGLLVLLHVDLRQLKDWQTLLGSLGVLGAATIAYFAAMAKVTLDRQLAAEELHRQKVGLQVKLALALQKLDSDALMLAERVRSLKNKPSWKNEVDRSWLVPEEFTLEEPPEIGEAWEHLELFDFEVSSKLLHIRSYLRRIKNRVARINEKTRPYPLANKQISEDLWNEVVWIADACRKIVWDLNVTPGARSGSRSVFTDEQVISPIASSWRIGGGSPSKMT